MFLNGPRTMAMCCLLNMCKMNTSLQVDIYFIHTRYQIQPGIKQHLAKSVESQLLQGSAKYVVKNQKIDQRYT